MAVIHSLKVTVFILTGKLVVIHCLSKTFSNSSLFPKKVSFSYEFFERHINYFYRILTAIHYFNGTVHYSDVKLCIHPVLSTDFFSAYFRTPVTMKQTSYGSGHIFRAASIILKGELLLKAVTLLQKDFFSD